MERRGVALDRARRVEHDVERLDLQVDELGRVLGGVGVVGDDDGDRLADVADGAVGEHGLEEGVERLVERPEADRDPRHRVEVGGGDARRARPGAARAAAVSTPTSRACADGDADDAHPELARAVDVVDEAAGAARAGGRPRRAGPSGRPSVMARRSAAPSAAARTASRIHW